MGSITMPSQRSTEATESFRRAWRSSGRTTVGPDTVRMAPISRESPIDVSKNRVVAPAPRIQVISTPTVTSRMTVDRPLSSRDSRSSKPPSNNKMATPNEIAGKSRSSRMTSGSMNPVTGPAITPAVSRKMMAGSPSRVATH